MPAITDRTSTATEESPSPSGAITAVPITFANKPALARFYRPELDALRFCAFLLVFLSHVLPRGASGYAPYLSSPRLRAFVAAVTNASGFGLCLFFMLSAYLITELLQREKEQTGTLSVKGFYQRRILRIWPIYYLALALGFVVMRRTSSDPHALERLAAFAFFAGNWFCSQNGWSANPSTPLWSVSVEEQFYLIWPWVMRRSRTFAFTVAIVALITANLVLIDMAKFRVSFPVPVWTNSFVQFSMFAPGVLTALVLRGRLPRFRVSTRLALLAGGIASWISASGLCHIGESAETATPGLPLLAGYFLVSLGTLFLLLSALGLQASIPSPIIALGKISYGLYVYHLFAIMAVEHIFSSFFPTHLGVPWKILQPALAFCLTVLMARISYDKFEVIFLRIKEKLTVVHSRPI
jgi:peptidoglycan/LPS O-acetylase OafA/YrhL